jgi:predicted XRE-type DNA-binding protein
MRAGDSRFRPNTTDSRSQPSVRTGIATTPRWSQGKDCVSRPNVFDQLGFSTEEATTLAIKSDLLTRIVRCAEHYSQARLQEILGKSQPRISNLMRGKIANFSLDRLVEYAIALNMRPEIKTHQPVAMLAAAR